MHPPEIINHPGSVLSLHEGVNTTFTVEASGENLQYQWLKDNVVLTNIAGKIEGVTTDRLILTDIALSDMGKYTVLVSNDAGMSTSMAALLSVGKFFGGQLKVTLTLIN